jgi:leucyl aminopeptidase
MQVQIGRTSPSNLATDTLVVGFFGKGGRRSPAWSALNRAIGGGLEGLLRVQGWKGKPGETLAFPAPDGLRAKMVLVGSLGERSKADAGSVRDLATKAGDLARKAQLDRIAFYLDSAMDDRAEFDRPTAQAIGEGLEWGAYRFDRHLAKPVEGGAPERVFVYFEGRRERPLIATAVERGAVVAQAENIARDLVNEPGNVLNPESIVDFARKLAEDKGIEIRVLDKTECQERGMNAFLAVNRGSSYQPALVHLIWKPEGAKQRIALVGKAVTFDSGGLCLKPAASQATMKMDMGGAAAVIGAMAACADLEVAAEVHGIFAAAENMTGADAYRTGDVLTASNGKTIEVLNTDAEGRLTLADALVYACEQEPDQLVDLATLTGACLVALGPSIAGIMGTSRGLLRDLKAAGDRAGEPMWELPMPDMYGELLKSKVADMSNLGGRWGGAITAGMFLKEFVTEGIPWVHMDIAGPAFDDAPLGGKPYGATGYPVRALAEWISFG